MSVEEFVTEVDGREGKVLSWASIIEEQTRAQAEMIDLNDFTPSPTVTIAVDGLSALMTEEADPNDFVFLSNDPGLGDPNVIIPGPFVSLVFDYVFDEELLARFRWIRERLKDRKFVLIDELLKEQAAQPEPLEARLAKKSPWGVAGTVVGLVGAGLAAIGLREQHKAREEARESNRSLDAQLPR